jgi:hypothetical protein
MRTRAYRPEFPACLEDRSLLSAAAGLPADPVVLPLRRFNFVVVHIRQSFDLFRRYRDVIQLRDEVDDVVAQIPFERVDGLGDSIDRIVNGMRHDLSAHVPHAIRSAQDDVLAATRAEVLARARAGDVVVR